VEQTKEVYRLLLRACQTQSAGGDRCLQLGTTLELHGLLFPSQPDSQAFKLALHWLLLLSSPSSTLLGQTCNEFKPDEIRNRLEELVSSYCTNEREPGFGDLVTRMKVLGLHSLPNSFIRYLSTVVHRMGSSSSRNSAKLGMDRLFYDFLNICNDPGFAVADNDHSRFLVSWMVRSAPEDRDDTLHNLVHVVDRERSLQDTDYMGWEDLLSSWLELVADHERCIAAEKLDNGSEREFKWRSHWELPVATQPVDFRNLQKHILSVLARSRHQRWRTAHWRPKPFLRDTSSHSTFPLRRARQACLLSWEGRSEMI
jgi:hypothetical protein